jgi:hypothetical protein
VAEVSGIDPNVFTGTRTRTPASTVTIEIRGRLNEERDLLWAELSLTTYAGIEPPTVETVRFETTRLDLILARNPTRYLEQRIEGVISDAFPEIARHVSDESIRHLAEQLRVQLRVQVRDARDPSIDDAVRRANEQRARRELTAAMLHGTSADGSYALADTRREVFAEQLRETQERIAAGLPEMIERGLHHPLGFSIQSVPGEHGRVHSIWDELDVDDKLERMRYLARAPFAWRLGEIDIFPPEEEIARLSDDQIEHATIMLDAGAGDGRDSGEEGVPAPRGHEWRDGLDQETAFSLLVLDWGDFNALRAAEAIEEWAHSFYWGPSVLRSLHPLEVIRRILHLPSPEFEPASDDPVDVAVADFVNFTLRDGVVRGPDPISILTGLESPLVYYEVGSLLRIGGELFRVDAREWFTEEARARVVLMPILDVGQGAIEVVGRVDSDELGWFYAEESL